MPDHEVAVSAVIRNERVLATAAVVSRLGGCVFLLVALGSGGNWVVVSVALAESAVLVAACWVTGRVRVWWTVADALVGIALFGLGAPLYNYVLVAVLLIGIAPLRLWWILPLSSSVAIAYIWSDVVRHGNPLWNVAPNAVNLVAMPIVAWMLASQIRTVARRIDIRRAEAVRRAEDLAVAGERARQSAELRARLLELLDQLAANDIVADSRVREQIEAEAGWLREFVDGDVPAYTDLRSALQAIADDRRRLGFEVTTRIDGELPELPAERIQAVLGAVWEALTNVAKHAGVDQATVRVRAGAGGLVIEVADAGLGFDLARTAGRVGLSRSIRRRLLEVDGSAVIESAPGRGTVVRMSLPGSPR